MTPAQCRAARALLSISQEALAAASGIGVQTLIAFESDRRKPYVNTLNAIRAALEFAGAVFLDENGNGPGVALRKG